jgi:hypothetical protein
MCLPHFRHACVSHTSARRLPRLQAEEYVPLPKGDVHKKKEIVQARRPGSSSRKHRT